MNEDFNTPRAFAELHKLITLIKSRILPNPSYLTAIEAYSALEDINRVLGLIDHIFTRVHEGPPTKRLIELLLDVRQIHRNRREYEIADYIAKKLREMGFVLEDYKSKTIWHYKKQGLENR